MGILVIGVDSGVERRLAVIPFDMTIPKSDRVVGIGRKVAAEHTDLIIALAIKELGTVLRQGFFSHFFWGNASWVSVNWRN